MYIIPSLTPASLKDADLTAWRARGLTLAHLRLSAAELDGGVSAAAALREAGFAVQLELCEGTGPKGAANALAACAGLTERIFLPLDVLAAPGRFLALLEQYGSLVGVSVSAEEGAVRLPAPFEPEAVKPTMAVRMLEASGVMAVLYRDVAAEGLPVGQLGDVASSTDVNLFAAGQLEAPEDLHTLRAMKLMGWLCPPVALDEMLHAAEVIK